MRFLLRTTALLAGAATAASLAVACLVADAPPDPPTPAPFPPVIATASVYPPVEQILTEFPTEFIVPVQLVNPAASFQYSVFIDYDPSNPTEPLLAATKTAGLDGVDGGFYDVEFSIDDPNVTSEAGATTCHLIEFIVALSFTEPDFHTPNPPGGTMVYWWYNPSGDLSGCPLLDPNADGSFPLPEGSTLDAGDGG